MQFNPFYCNRFWAWYKCIRLTWYLSSLTMQTAAFGTVRPLHGSHRNGQQRYNRSKNIYSVGSMSTLFLAKKIDPVKVTFCVFFYNLFLLKIFWLSTSLHCSRETAQSCQFYDSVFETNDVTGEWRRLHNKELYTLYSSPNIIRVIMSRRLRWAGHVARMGERRGAYRALVGNWGKEIVNNWQ
jgi:hypothetical protein